MFFMKTSMVVYELDILGATRRPAKAEAILVVDANGMLARPVALQWLEAVVRR